MCGDQSLTDPRTFRRLTTWMRNRTGSKRVTNIHQGLLLPEVSSVNRWFCTEEYDVDFLRRLTANPSCSDTGQLPR